MTYDEIYGMIEETVNGIVSSTEPVPAHNLGLDARCGMLLVGEDFIATTTPKMLDYYGGFEYITEGRRSVGEITIYFAEGNTRVQDALDDFKATTKE